MDGWPARRIDERWNLIRPPSSNLAATDLDVPKAPPAERTCGDVELMIRARAGDRAAYGQIVARYQDRLFNALLRFVGETGQASDLTRQTFTHGLTRVEHFERDWPAYTWLLQMGIELAMERLGQDRRRRSFFSDAAVSDWQIEPWQRTLLEALSRLEPTDRAVVILREIEGLERQQIANALNIPMKSLGGRLLQARLALRDQLAEIYGQH